MAEFFSRFPKRATQPADDHEVIEATDARQGRWGRHVFWVLVISTFLAAGGMFIAWSAHWGDLEGASQRSTPTVAEATASGGRDAPVKQ